MAAVMKRISFILALALILAGGLVLAFQMLGTWEGVTVLAGCVMIWVGGYLLLVDFFSTTRKKRKG